jgi:hypothetical protein
MFGGREVARFETRRTGAKLDEWIEDGLSPLGDVEVRGNGNVRIRPTSGLRNSWCEVRIDGRVRERRDGEVEVEVTYDLIVGAGTWVIGVMIILLGVIILVSLNQTQTQIARRIRDVLADMEDDADAGR